MIALLKPFAWRIGAVGAAVGLLLVSGLLISASVENRRISAVNRALDDRISNPRTGYVVRLAQSETNAKTLQTGLERQVTALRVKAEADAAKLAETERLLALAQADSRVARRRAADLTARAPVGETLEQRVLDVDGKVLESLR